jgi:AraC family ethanolamine operon transcriptional activator
MEYAEFAADLPSHRTVSFMSAEENEETMRRLGVAQRVRQLGRGRFRAELAARCTESVDLYADRFSKACSVFLEPPADTVVLLVLRSAAGRVRASGCPVAGDKLVVLPPGSGTDLTTPDVSGSEGLAIPVAQFEEMAEVLCPASKRLRMQSMTVIEGSAAQLQKLAKSVLELIARERNPGGEEISDLVAGTILWIERHSDGPRSEELGVARSRRRVAKLAQEFIEERYRGTVRTEDLCRVTGVGARVLQQCFREYFDLTCTEYLKAVRLDAAHRALIAAPCAPGSVSAVALDHGFNHFGRFSVEFRRRFGQSPHETLRHTRVRVSTTRSASEDESTIHV